MKLMLFVFSVVSMLAPLTGCHYTQHSAFTSSTTNPRIESAIDEALRDTTSWDAQSDRIAGLVDWQQIPFTRWLNRAVMPRNNAERTVMLPLAERGRFANWYFEAEEVIEVRIAEGGAEIVSRIDEEDAVIPDDHDTRTRTGEAVRRARAEILGSESRVLPDGRVVREIDRDVWLSDGAFPVSVSYGENVRYLVCVVYAPGAHDAPLRLHADGINELIFAQHRVTPWRPTLAGARFVHTHLEDPHSDRPPPGWDAIPEVLTVYGVYIELPADRTELTITFESGDGVP